MTLLPIWSRVPSSFGTAPCTAPPTVPVGRKERDTDQKQQLPRLRNPRHPCGGGWACPAQCFAKYVHGSDALQPRRRVASGRCPLLLQRNTVTIVSNRAGWVVCAITALTNTRSRVSATSFSFEPSFAVTHLVQMTRHCLLVTSTRGTTSYTSLLSRNA